MEWPSRELSQRLAEWRLCTPHDVARCRPTVRRLSRDLPAFDSVWIDALSQSRVLTPFQSKVLDSPYPDRLRIGSYILIDRQEEGTWRRVERARPIDGNDPLLLTVHEPHPDDCARVASRMAEVVERFRATPDGTLILPRTVSVDRGRIVIAAADVKGTTLRELLVCRGRFPDDVVMAVARDLIAALALLEDAAIPHGDVRLRNVRLTDRGEVRLLHAGLLPAIEPDYVINSPLPLDAFDGLAPELSRGVADPSANTDRYALGCLLWQLLAGRPPFPTGDPLARLTAHQMRRVPDIRDLAPETPRRLAELVTALTQSDPRSRPSSFRSLLAILGGPRATDRRCLQRFATSFQGNPPYLTAGVESRTPRYGSTLVTAAVLAAVSFGLFRAGIPTELLRLGETRDPSSVREPRKKPAPRNGTTPVAAATNADPPATPASSVVSSPQPAPRAPLPGTLALPKPDPEGVVWLAAGATYSGRDLTTRGPLTIRAAAGAPAHIVSAAAWSLRAESVRLENVELSPAASDVDVAGPFVNIQSRTLDVLHSILHGPDPGRPLIIEWRPAHPSTAPLSSVTFEDSLLVNATLDLPVRPAEVRLTNCLKTGPSVGVRYGETGRSHQTIHLTLTQTTVRGSGPIVAIQPGSAAAGLRLEVAANACVLDPASARPLLEFIARPPQDWPRTIELTGMGSIVAAQAALIGVSAEVAGAEELNADRLSADGLVAGSLEYRGPSPTSPRESELLRTDAVRSAQTLPGIIAPRLPELTSKPGAGIPSS